MNNFKRITHNAGVMGGKACIAGTRVTVGMILMQISDGITPNDLLVEYPNLTIADIEEALRYAAWAVGSKEEVILTA